MRLGPLLLLALAPAAFAQGTLTVQFQDDDLLTVGADDCDANIPLNWTATGGGSAPCDDGLALWVSARTTCGDEPQDGDLDLGTVSASDFAAGSGRISFTLGSLFDADSGADGGSGCGELGIEKTFIGCGRYTVPSNIYSGCGTTTAVTNSTRPKLVYDALAPEVPVLESLVPLDGALLAKVSTTTDAATVVLFVKEASAPESAYAAATTFSTEATSGKIDGLQNGVSYSVKAYAEDLVANRSEASGELTGTPENSEGFFGNYRRMGGAEEGGCSAVGGGSMVSALVLLVLGAAFLRRRR